MKVSIITPTHNVESTVENAILSVKNQRFDNYEHIVVDACSTDRTLEIIQEYPHIRYISEPDSGIYDAMNKGVKLAHGEWVYFLGADDELCSDDVLTEICTELVDPFDVVYGDVFSDRFNGRYGGEFSHERLLGDDNICHQAIFFNKRVFSIVGFFNVKYLAQSDWDHNLRWIFNADIRSRYVDMIISNFADGGFSSKSGDSSFQKDKRFNYVQYGHTVLPWKNSLRILYGETKVSIKHLNIRKLVLCVALGLKVCGLRLTNRL